MAPRRQYPFNTNDFGGYRYRSEIMKENDTAGVFDLDIEPLPPYVGPPVIIGFTVVFDMPRPSFWQSLDAKAQFGFKKQYLKTIYLSKLLWFQDDGPPPTAATRIHIYNYDYFARFEVDGHQYEPYQFRTSMILLHHLCRDETAQPKDYDLRLFQDLKAARRQQTDLYSARIGFSEALKEATPKDNVRETPVSTPTNPLRLDAKAQKKLKLERKLAAIQRMKATPIGRLPKKFVEVQHIDVPTSAATQMLARFYQLAKADGRRRRMCTKYEVGREKHNSLPEIGMVVNFEVDPSVRFESL